MDIILILLVLLVFMLPSILMMRSQKKRQQQVQEMQSSIQPGDHVVTVSGLHGDVVDADNATLRIEIAPGVVVKMEAAGIMKREAVESAVQEPTVDDSEQRPE